MDVIIILKKIVYNIVRCIPHDVYRSKNCMKKFCESLREHEMKEINFKRKKIEVINEKVAGIIKKCKHLLYSRNYKIKNM